MEASLTTDPDNEDLKKLKKDLKVSDICNTFVIQQGASGVGCDGKNTFLQDQINLELSYKELIYCKNLTVLIIS